ncbi:MAG: sigma-70 family RNA polymerase sigma factor [Myxococcales bacterium]
MRTSLNRSSGASAMELEPAPVVSFQALYVDWLDDVRGWVRSLGVPDADRDDLVQDIFLVAHRRLSDFDGRNAAGWLYQIARRKVRDHRRLVWVEHFFGHGRVALADDTLTTSEGPLEELESKRQRLLLAWLLDGLSENQRAALLLFELEGRGGAEIAQMVGVPVKTVWLWLHRARKMLSLRAAKLRSLDRRTLPAKPGRKLIGNPRVPSLLQWRDSSPCC